jgi:hypothetical protein
MLLDEAQDGGGDFVGRGEEELRFPLRDSELRTII